jgi:hypothetical protein
MDIRYEVGIFEQEQSEICDDLCAKENVITFKEIDHHKKKRLLAKEIAYNYLKSHKGCTRSAGLSLIILTKY